MDVYATIENLPAHATFGGLRTKNERERENNEGRI